MLETIHSCQVHHGAITVGLVKGHSSKTEFLGLTTDGLLSSKQFQALNLILLAADTEEGHRECKEAQKGAVASHKLVSRFCPCSGFLGHGFALSWRYMAFALFRLLLRFAGCRRSHGTSTSTPKRPPGTKIQSHLQTSKSFKSFKSSTQFVQPSQTKANQQENLAA